MTGPMECAGRAKRRRRFWPCRKLPNKVVLSFGFRKRRRRFALPAHSKELAPFA
jgi:hypothetical protein